MAEFCLDCYNKTMTKGSKPLKENDVILDYDFCEECQSWKLCIITLKPNTIGGRIRRLLNKIKKKEGVSK